MKEQKIINKNRVFSIPLPKDFNIAIHIDYLARNKNECMYRLEGHSITKAIVVDHSIYLIRISFNDNGSASIYYLECRNAANDWHQAYIRDYISEWFDFERDLNPFYQLAQTDPLLQKPARIFHGLRLIGMPDFFEALCWGIIGQQINLPFAYSLKKQFVERFGDSIDYAGQKYMIFPTAERIAKLNPKDISTVKMTVRKSEYLIGAARLIVNGLLSKEELLNLTFKEAENKLQSIRGIGPWTANYVLMRCLKFIPAFPVDDAGFINAVKLQLNTSVKPTKQELQAFASSWRGWESYAVFYLWRLLY